jgi:hypothetical protein
MMLSAIAASTGGDGTSTKPSVASASVMLWASEGGDGLDQHPGAAHDQQQPEHEQQVIDTKQDVLDAEAEVAHGSVPKRAGARLQRGERHLDRSAGACEELPGGRAVRPAHGQHDALALPRQAQHIQRRERLPGARELVAHRGLNRRERTLRAAAAASLRQLRRAEHLGQIRRRFDLEDVVRRGQLFEHGARDAKIVRQRRCRRCQQNRRQQRQRRSRKQACALTRAAAR